MFWWLVVGSGAPLVVVIGLTFGLVLAHLDARKKRSWNDLDSGWSEVISADRRRGRWAAGIVIVGWACMAVLRVSGALVFAWWLFVVPIVAGVIGVFFVGLPSRGERSRRASTAAAVDYRRRGLSAFASPLAIATAISVFVVTVLTVVAAGFMSSSDENGWYTQFTMPVGDTTAGTTFFGWYFGIPVLVGTAVLAGATWFRLRQVAHTPIAAQWRFNDEFLREQRATSLLRIATGTTCVVIGAAWGLIAGAAQLRTAIPGTGVGVVEFGTSFAAIGVVLGITGYVLQGFGLALLISVLARRRTPATSETTPVESVATRA